MVNFGSSPLRVLRLKCTLDPKSPAQCVRSQETDSFSSLANVFCIVPSPGRAGEWCWLPTPLWGRSIAPELEEILEALGIPTPTSLDVEYYFQNPVGHGQPEQSRLPFVPKRSGGHSMAVEGVCSVVTIHDTESAETQGCQEREAVDGVQHT